LIVSGVFTQIWIITSISLRKWGLQIGLKRGRSTTNGKGKAEQIRAAGNRPTRFFHKDWMTPRLISIIIDRKGTLQVAIERESARGETMHEKNWSYGYA